MKIQTPSNGVEVQFGILHDGVIPSVTVFQEMRRISFLTSFAYTPAAPPLTGTLGCHYNNDRQASARPWKSSRIAFESLL
jgi:hypothetical protein